MKQQHKVNAVLEEDLGKILDELGFRNLSEQGEKCFYCMGQIKAIEEVSSIYIVKGVPKLKCDRSDCKVKT